MEIVNVCRAVVEPNEMCFKNSKKNGNMTRVLPNDDLNNVQEWSKFSAEAFVENLLAEGPNVPCDETSESFNNSLQVPPFYDEDLFKTGQNFFHKNIFGLLLSKLLGLLALLAIPPVEILVLTNMSSTSMTAYKRYMATIFHMCLWYDNDFRPGSSSWMSLTKVRNMHNSASNRSNICLGHGINQKHMAMTQFGFMGLALARSRMMGIHHASEKELKGFVHLWRTIGYVLGIEDRFNICRESVKETKEICNLIIEKVFRPGLDKPLPDFDRMSRALIDGMWVMNPFLEYDVFLLYLRMSLDNDNDTSTPSSFRKLSWRGKMKLYFIFYTLWSLKFNVCRTFHNYLQVFGLWLMERFPYLAFYMFGRENSYVSIR